MDWEHVPTHECVGTNLFRDLYVNLGIDDCKLFYINNLDKIRIRTCRDVFC